MKETLEEVAERLYPVHIKSILDKYDDGVTNVVGKEDINEDCRESFIEGAKWEQENSNVNALHFEIDALKRLVKVLEHQQERSYSEEEVVNLIEDWTKMAEGLNLNFPSGKFEKWFEQFKKK
ncbi:MAG: hypothetical protein WCK82_12955 [Bacteroidota bacterium]